MDPSISKRIRKEPKLEPGPGEVIWRKPIQSAPITFLSLSLTKWVGEAQKPRQAGEAKTRGETPRVGGRATRIRTETGSPFGLEPRCAPSSSPN